MKILLTFLFFTFTLFIYAQDDVYYPDLKSKSATLEGFIPSGWQVLAQDKGDLNKDSFDDIVFVLESNTSYKVLDDWRERATDYNPRILGIALWDNATNAYKLNVQSNDFIITIAENTSMDEPFAGLEIKKGTIHFNFYYWFSMGSWYVTNQTFVFRYQNNQFELIGFQSNSFHRSSHGSSNVSINYSTRKGNSYYSESEEEKGETKWGTFKMDKLLTFDTVGNPYMFSEPELNFDSKK